MDILQVLKRAGSGKSNETQTIDIFCLINNNNIRPNKTTHIYIPEVVKPEIEWNVHQISVQLFFLSRKVSVWKC